MSTIEPSRRGFLVGAGLAGLAVAGASWLTPASARADVGTASAADLLTRRREALTAAAELAAIQSAVPAPPYAAGLAAKVSAMSSAAGELLGSMLPVNAPRTEVWADLSMSVPSAATRSVNLGEHFIRFASIATAWATPGTSQYGKPEVSAALNAGLATMAAHYASGKSAYGNWWFWEIGVPRRAADVYTLLGSAADPVPKASLLAAARYFAPNPARRGRSATGMLETGANLADKALNTALRGPLDETEADIVAARDALSGGPNPANSLFARVTSGDGFYADGSFIQHGYLPYVGTYGVVALSGVGQVLSLLNGSPWAVSDPALGTIFDNVHRALSPYLLNGRVMEVVRGRAVSRVFERDYDSGFGALTATLTLAESASGAQASALQSLVKGWVDRYRGPDYSTGSFALAGAVQLLKLREDASVRATPPLVLTQFHAAHERLIHRRERWSFSVNTSSARIGRFEWGNTENGRGWYQGDGQAFLYVDAEPGQFSDDFWPTVDSLALPGITASAVPRTNGVANGTGIPRANNSYNGGVTLDNSAGTVAMNVIGFTDTTTPGTTALKSWYTFDDAVVCVGTDIADVSGTQTSTVVENRGYPVGGVPRFTWGDPGKQPRLDATARRFSSWAHLDGVGGYVLLAPRGQRAEPGWVARTRRTGAWTDINGSPTPPEGTGERTREFVQIAVRHGESPTAGRYAYLILPNASAKATKRRAKDPQVRVVTAAGVGHLVHHQPSRTSFAHLFSPGTVDGVTATRPVAVGWRSGRSSTTIAISLPDGGFYTQVTFPFDVSAVEENAAAIVLSLAPLTLMVFPSGQRGSAVNLTATH